MPDEYIPQEILRGKIIATKSLVKKQIRGIMEIEGEVEKLLEDTNIEEITVEKAKVLAEKFREFQICVENALAFIAENFDGGIPVAANVHEKLLDQMTKSIENSRPPVFDNSLAQILKEYIDLRLVLEKDCESFDDCERVKKLLGSYKEVSQKAREQLTNFFDELEKFHGFKK